MNSYCHENTLHFYQFLISQITQGLCRKIKNLRLQSAHFKIIVLIILVNTCLKIIMDANRGDLAAFSSQD